MSSVKLLNKIDLIIKRKINISRYVLCYLIFKLVLNIKQLISYIKFIKFLNDRIFEKNKNVISNPMLFFSLFAEYLYLYLESFISRLVQFLQWNLVRKLLKNFKIFSLKMLRKKIKLYGCSRYLFNFFSIDKTVSLIVKSVDPFKFLALLFNYKYIKLSCQKIFLPLVDYDKDKDDDNVLVFLNSCVKVYKYNLQLAQDTINHFSVDILSFYPVLVQFYNAVLTSEERNKNRLQFLFSYKYMQYLKKFNMDLSSNNLYFLRKNYPRDIFLNKLKFIKRPIKLLRNSIYQKNFYKFISISFFKKYLNILYLWFFNTSFRTSKLKLHRNVFILYMKHLNFSFFSRYLLWIKKSKRIVITLNVNIVKNNLFYTLMNSSGDTIATLSSGLYYALPRNRNLKRNPFKKSIAYLTSEMFSLMFYNKFVFPLQYYKWDKKLEFFKNPPLRNGDLEWKKLGNKRFFNKQQKVYFIFKFARHKHAFPGLSRNIISLLGQKSNKKLYEFVGLYKAYPRIHNGLSKKRPRRL